MGEGATQFEYGNGLETKAWTALADDLPVIGKAEILSLNLFFSFCGPIEFEFENRTYTLLFQPGGAPGYPARNRTGTIVDVAVADVTVRIRLEHLAFIDMFRLPQARYLPGELYMALLEVCMQPLFDRFEAFSGMPVGITGVRHSSQADAGGFNRSQDSVLDIAFDMIRADNQALIQGCISLPVTLLQRFGRLLAGRSAAPDDSLMRPVLFELAFVLGQTALPLYDLRQLSSGDIVLMDVSRDNFLEDNIMIFAPDGSFWRGRVTESILAVNSELENGPMENEDETEEQQEQTEELESSTYEDAEMDPDLSEEVEPDESDLQQPDETDLQQADETFGRLPVNMVFELDRKTITLGELRKIKPGYTFELSKELQKPVRVMANGRFIGRGELVRIDHRLGVRLIELKY